MAIVSLLFVRCLLMEPAVFVVERDWLEECLWEGMSSVKLVIFVSDYKTFDLFILWVICQWQISTKKSPFCCKYIARDIWPVLRASFRTNQLCVSISFISIQKIYFARPSGALTLIQTSHLLEEAHFLDSIVHSKKSNLLQTITAFDSNDRSTRKVGNKVAKD